MRLRELGKLLDETKKRTEEIGERLLKEKNKTFKNQELNLNEMKLEYEKKSLGEMKDNIKRYMERLNYLKKVREYENNSWGSKE